MCFSETEVTNTPVLECKGCVGLDIKLREAYEKIAALEKTVTSQNDSLRKKEAQIDTLHKENEKLRLNVKFRKDDTSRK